MPAAKEKIGFQLVARVMALLLLLAALTAPAQARSAAENRVWQKSTSNTESLHSQPLQLLEPHQVKAPVGWYDASDDTFAVNNELTAGATHAGAFLNWDIQNSMRLLSIPIQKGDVECGETAASMILNESGVKTSVKELGVLANADPEKGTTAIGLLTACFRLLDKNGGWTGKLVLPGKELEFIATQKNPWLAYGCAATQNCGAAAHWVTVDGFSSEGNIMIRDTWDGTQYTVTSETWLKNFEGRALFRGGAE